MIKTISTNKPGWKDTLKGVLARGRNTPKGVEKTVGSIIEEIRTRGDTALFEYARKLDRFDPFEEGFIIDSGEIDRAAQGVDPDLYAALKIAAERIDAFHRHQVEESWISMDEKGVILGQKITPIESVGVYVPGGKNAFPSTLLMNVIPAKIAGVERIEVASPTPDGQVNPVLLAAAKIAGVKKIYRMGGAQAIAALAFGTDIVPAVDKVVGPGNIYVANAKKALLGTIGIDSFAGPSEILVIADDRADPRMVAMDMLSQAEHDEDACAILVTPHKELATRVLDLLSEFMEGLPRRQIIRSSLERHGACIITRDLSEAIEVSNMVAPEHLELMVQDPYAYLGCIRNAGAIFLGTWAPEAIGDYMAGPNHTLPTASTSRFSSPLGVYDFVKRSSIISFSGELMEALGEPAARIARAENLEAHARSVEERLK
ncbi:MAG: histidinol dehydrogenase [Thermodesulfobacteriota bacterium]|nr:histidinol dehydrogenase [Thermodesulfobacteriota bacterium]